MDKPSNQVSVPKEDLLGRFFSERQAFIGYAYHFTLDPDAAQDMFQEACLKFLETPASFACFPMAVKYLYKILFSLAVERQRQSCRLIYPARIPEMICEPEPHWQRQMMIERVRNLICSLPANERRLLAVHTLPKLNLRQKSEMMHLPLSTYRYQVKREISKLRKRLMAGAKTIGRLSQTGGN